jgi:hypothetical protein
MAPTSAWFDWAMLSAVFAGCVTASPQSLSAAIVGQQRLGLIRATQVQTILFSQHSRRGVGRRGIHERTRVPGSAHSLSAPI